MSYPSFATADTGAIVAATPNWLNERTLRPIREVNALFLDLLQQCSKASGRSAIVNPPLDAGVLRQLHTTSAPTRQRLAETLFLLVDLHFESVDWWTGAWKQTPPLERTWIDTVPRKLALEVAQASLMLAWHTARSHADAARLLVGLHPSVTEVLADLSLAEVGRVALRHVSSLRARWRDRPAVWEPLLCVAKGDSQAAWRDFHLEALQQVAADLNDPHVAHRNKRRL